MPQSLYSIPFLKADEKNGGQTFLKKERKYVFKNITRYVLPCDIYKFMIFRITDTLMEMPMFYLQKHNLHAIKIIKL